MRRHRVLVIVLTAGGLLAIFFGPVIVRLLFTDLPEEYRALRAAAQSERIREAHLPEIPFAARWPEAILHAAAAPRVTVVRLDPARNTNSTNSDCVGCFYRYRVLREVPVGGRIWGSRFLTLVLRAATLSRGAGEGRGIPDSLVLRYGIRFSGQNTTDVLLATGRNLRGWALLFVWSDASGRAHQAAANLPVQLEGDQEADSTLQKLSPLTFTH